MVKMLNCGGAGYSLKGKNSEMVERKETFI